MRVSIKSCCNVFDVKHLSLAVSVFAVLDSLFLGTTSPCYPLLIFLLGDPLAREF